MTQANKYFFVFLASCLVLLLNCSSRTDNNFTGNHQETEAFAKLPDDADSQAKGRATAVFASGCFWCTEAVFERVTGVQKVISGYAGGIQKNPNYKEVSAGKSDHAEAVIVYYDSTQVGYERLLDIFFHSHDPTQLNRQGPDVGKQYRSGIYFSSNYQKEKAEAYLQQLRDKGEFDKPIVTEIKPLSKFWPAENYHQDYYRLHPDDPYIRTVSEPKVRKFEKEYAQYLKKEFRKK